jgi:hypothetical protein
MEEGMPHGLFNCASCGEDVDKIDDYGECELCQRTTECRRCGDVLPCDEDTGCCDECSHRMYRAMDNDRED